VGQRNEAAMNKYAGRRNVLSPDLILGDVIGVFDAEVSRGIVHTPEYVAEIEKVRIERVAYDRYWADYAEAWEQNYWRNVSAGVLPHQLKRKAEEDKIFQKRLTKEIEAGRLTKTN
jgi:hypothetical protein